MILASIMIEMNWPAVAVVVTLIMGYLATVGALFWKLYDHSTDDQRHLRKDQKLITTETCKATKEAIEKDQVETRKYIADVEKRAADALKAVQKTIENRFDDMKGILEKLIQ